MCLTNETICEVFLVLYVTYFSLLGSFRKIFYAHTHQVWHILVKINISMNKCLHVFLNDILNHELTDIIKPTFILSTLWFLIIFDCRSGKSFKSWKNSNAARPEDQCFGQRVQRDFTGEFAQHDTGLQWYINAMLIVLTEESIVGFLWHSTWNMVCHFKEYFYGSCCVYKIILAKSSFEILPQEFCIQADILPFSFFSPHSLLFILRPGEGYGRCERRSRPSFSSRPRSDGRRQDVVAQERLGGCQIREDIFIGCCGCKSLS